MNQASNFLQDIIVPQQWIPTGYCNFSIDLPLVDKVVNPVPSSIDPTLSLESEEQVVHPTLLLKSEVKMVDLVSSPLNTTLSSKSIKTEVVTLTQYLSPPFLLVESKKKAVVVFIVLEQ